MSFNVTCGFFPWDFRKADETSTHWNTCLHEQTWYKHVDMLERKFKKKHNNVQKYMLYYLSFFPSQIIQVAYNINQYEINDRKRII